ncbi:MAG: hypothetical protein OHK005_04220 [Candidatus Methylacidiphilales bacterium]
MKPFRYPQSCRGQAATEYILIGTMLVLVGVGLMRLMTSDSDGPIVSDVPPVFTDYYLVRTIVKPPYWSLPKGIDWISEFIPQADIPFWDALRAAIFDHTDEGG